MKHEATAYRAAIQILAGEKECRTHAYNVMCTEVAGSTGRTLQMFPSCKHRSKHTGFKHKEIRTRVKLKL